MFTVCRNSATSLISDYTIEITAPAAPFYEKPRHQVQELPLPSKSSPHPQRKNENPRSGSHDPAESGSESLPPL